MTSFGLAILSNVLVASCIAACAFCTGLRVGRSATAHVLWIAVFVKLITPPLYPIPLPLPSQWYDGLVAASPSSSPGLGLFIQNGSSVMGKYPGPPSAIQEKYPSGESLPSARHSIGGLNGLTLLSCVLSACWLIVALLLLGKGVTQFCRFSRLLRNRGEYSKEGHNGVRNLLIGRAGSRAPSVLLVPIDIAPMLFGIGRSTSIVCPRRLWDTLVIEKRNAFLAHEVAHYLRRDHWVRWLEWIVSAIYWWLPLTYLARRQLERNEEMSCDQWVVNQLHIKRRAYAETLLQVVEYLEDTRVASPRLASHMHSTDLLEKRVASILRQSEPKSRFYLGRHLAFALVVLLLLAHPYPYRHNIAGARESTRWAASISIPPQPTEIRPALIDQTNQALEPALPRAPSGWWNATTIGQWANVFLPDSGVRLLAHAGAGVRIQLADGRNMAFAVEHLSACAEIPGTNRMVIADASGAMRLWDLTDGTAVSLIGRHAGDITSVAFHEAAGLVAADAQGSVIRWDHRSGAPLQTWTTQTGPVQSIRWSHSGESLAVLLGSWTRVAADRQLVILDANQFEERESVALPVESAVVWEDRTYGWLCVNWQGHIHTLSGKSISRIDKETVSAFLLSQNAIIPIDEQQSASEETTK